MKKYLNTKQAIAYIGLTKQSWHNNWRKWGLSIFRKNGLKPKYFDVNELQKIKEMFTYRKVLSDVSLENYEDVLSRKVKKITSGRRGNNPKNNAEQTGDSTN